MGLKIESQQKETLVYKEVIKLAEEIVRGKYRPFIGVRLLIPYLIDFELDMDDRFICIKAIDSEFDDLPLEDNVRKSWEEEALKKKDERADEFEKKSEFEIITACQELILELENRLV